MSSGIETAKSEDTGWIVTHTGRKVYPLEPSPDMFCLQDVAHALSNTCRFTGHCRQFYSVAQHSVLVSQLVHHRTGSVRLARHGLMHDATEAYLCDIARPVKHADGFAFYRQAEARLWSSIAHGFGLEEEQPAEVTEVDNRIVCNEALALLSAIPDGWFNMRPFTESELEAATGHKWIKPVDPDSAYKAFICQYYKLDGDQE
jgi:hypothetical protein